jgi:hypothetical protein
MTDTPRLPVRVRGTLRGVSVDVDGTVRLLDDVVSIHVEDREHTTRVDRVDGVVWEAPVLTVHVSRDVVELSGHAGVQPLGAQIVAAALAFPELTRTMRGLGSRRGYPGSDHDRFFASLLTARRAAEGFAEPESRLSAFDSRRLAQAITTLLGQFAAERYPESPPDRRALEAELLDHAERLYATLDALGEAAADVRSSTAPVRLARWRDWTRAAHRVFEEADRCWIAVVPALSAAPVPVSRPRFWRRRRGAGVIVPILAHAALNVVRAATGT